MRVTVSCMYHVYRERYLYWPVVFESPTGEHIYIYDDMSQVSLDYAQTKTYSATNSRTSTIVM